MAEPITLTPEMLAAWDIPTISFADMLAQRQADIEKLNTAPCTPDGRIAK